MLKKYLKNLIDTAYESNVDNILMSANGSKDSKILDLGCDDGSLTVRLGNACGSKNLYGVEVVESRKIEAEKRGVRVTCADLNGKLNFPDNSFDIILSNQVVEHLNNTDLFIEEIYRLLKKNGIGLISTENLASWHNIFSLLFGFQPFSMANFSKYGSIGNPMSLWRDTNGPNSDLYSWQHQRLFSYYGLKELFEKHGFNVERILTSGYYPLPGILSKLDPVHGHWILYKVIKQ